MAKPNYLKVKVKKMEMIENTETVKITKYYTPLAKGTIEIKTLNKLHIIKFKIYLYFSKQDMVKMVDFTPKTNKKIKNLKEFYDLDFSNIFKKFNEINKVKVYFKNS